MWRDKYSKTIHPYFTYLISRAWRLLPAFWLITAVTILADAMARTIPHPINFPLEIFSNILLLGYNYLNYMPIASAWSLDIEFQFYLIAPVLILAASLWRGRLWIFFLLASAALSAVSWHWFQREEEIIIQCIGFFAIGMTAAGLHWRPSARLGWLSLAVTAIAVASVIISPWRALILGGVHPAPLYFAYGGPTEIVVTLLLAPWAIYTTENRGGVNDAMFGDLSYIVYLTHFQFLTWSGVGGERNWHRVVVTLAAYAATFVVSWLIWRYVDKPINNIRARWVAKRKAAVSGDRLAQMQEESLVPAELS